MGKTIRLDKYLADMKIGSRTEVKQLIKKGKVTVDGQKVNRPEMKIEPDVSRVIVEGNEIGYIEKEYWMLYKPAGVVSATEDKQCTTVVDLLKDASRKDLFPVGRLDKDTEGLLLLTNDGELAHELLSPKKHVDKTYYARISGIVTNEDVKAFEEGLDIGEKCLTMPAKLMICAVCEESCESEIKVTIQEGKFHQVKRMFEAVGKKVVYLKRLSMGSLSLDERLEIGESRMLTKEEVEGLKKGQDHTDEIQAVIFDLDGTVVDSMWMWDKIDEEFLGQFGSEVPTDMQEAIEGMSFTETACYFKERFKFLPFSVEQLKEIWNEMAYDKYANEVPLKPGVLEYLKYLKENGIKTGIASSNSKELVMTAIQNLGVEQYFDSVHTACEVEKGKPAPDIYLLVAKDLGIDPCHCMVFEDVPAGIMAGNSAGMKTYAVADVYSENLKEQKKELADAYIETYFEMLPK